eukprot:Colp12_sorted_trinity150504_noHs@36349
MMTTTSLTGRRSISDACWWFQIGLWRHTCLLETGLLQQMFHNVVEHKAPVAEPLELIGRIIADGTADADREPGRTVEFVHKQVYITRESAAQPLLLSQLVECSPAHWRSLLSSLEYSRNVIPDHLRELKSPHKFDQLLEIMTTWPDTAALLMREENISRILNSTEPHGVVFLNYMAQHTTLGPGMHHRFLMSPLLRAAICNYMFDLLRVKTVPASHDSELATVTHVPLFALRTRADRSAFFSALVKELTFVTHINTAALVLLSFPRLLPQLLNPDVAGCLFLAMLYLAPGEAQLPLLPNSHDVAEVYGRLSLPQRQLCQELLTHAAHKWQQHVFLHTRERLACALHDAILWAATSQLNATRMYDLIVRPLGVVHALGDAVAQQVNDGTITLRRCLHGMSKLERWVPFDSNELAILRKAQLPRR